MSYRARCARRTYLHTTVPVYLGTGISFFMTAKSFLKLGRGARLGIDPEILWVTTKPWSPWTASSWYLDG